MGDIYTILAKMKQNPKGIQFVDLCKVCTHFFGKPRKSSGSHRIYRTPWQGNPRINIQNTKGMAKAYQVNQVISAIQKLEENDVSEK